MALRLAGGGRADRRRLLRHRAAAHRRRAGAAGGHAPGPAAAARARRRRRTARPRRRPPAARRGRTGAAARSTRCPSPTSPATPASSCPAARASWPGATSRARGSARASAASTSAAARASSAVQLALNGAAHVHAIDIDARAVANTLTNAFRNDVADRVTAAAEDLLPWVPEERYEVIVASLCQQPVDPFQPGAGHRRTDYWGRSLVDQLLAKLPAALAPEGVAYVVHLSILSREATDRALAEAGLGRRGGRRRRAAVPARAGGVAHAGAARRGAERRPPPGARRPRRGGGLPARDPARRPPPGLRPAAVAGGAMTRAAAPGAAERVAALLDARGPAPALPGPDALRQAHRALLEELAGARRRRGRAAARARRPARRGGLRRARCAAHERLAAALARLDEAGPVSEVVDRAARRGGRGGRPGPRRPQPRRRRRPLVAEAVHWRDDPGLGATTLGLLRERPVRLDHPLIESEMVRRRRPLLVPDPAADPRGRPANADVLGWGALVCAPVVLDGRVAGFLHGDRAPSGGRVGALERDVLWAFAQGFAQVVERADPAPPRCASSARRCARWRAGRTRAPPSSATARSTSPPTARPPIRPRRGAPAAPRTPSCATS